jgi:hypothetical protein
MAVNLSGESDDDGNAACECLKILTNARELLDMLSQFIESAEIRYASALAVSCQDEAH